MALAIHIYRKDFEQMREQFWGKYDGKKLQMRLGMTEHEFRSKIKVQFEIAHTLQFKLLLCQGSPFYWIAENLPKIDLKAAIAKENVSCQNQPIFSEDGRLLCDIGINVLEGASVYKTDAHDLIFAAEADRNAFKTFCCGDEKRRGLISQPLPSFPETGKHQFYFRDRDQWFRIGELSRPASTPEYHCKYYVTLDDQGSLCIHAGEVPYWISTDETALHQPGCVCSAALDLQPNDVDEKRDPFCGLH
jgi:hypothetical protein